MESAYALDPVPDKQKEWISSRRMISHEDMIAGLQLWEDHEARTPAGQMAMDEALLQQARQPVVRLYRWSTPAVTFGYAQRHSEVRINAGSLPMIRRWTGGGTVFHGQDLTIAIAVPRDHGFSRLQTGMIYRQIHEALLEAVKQVYPEARLAGPGDCLHGPACFEAPALNDILQGRRKICGGALRRGRPGFLYQGSLHGNFSAISLGRSLCPSIGLFEPDKEVFQTHCRLAGEKYQTVNWNQMR